MRHNQHDTFANVHDALAQRVQDRVERLKPVIDQLYEIMQKAGTSGSMFPTNVVLDGRTGRAYLIPAGGSGEGDGGAGGGAADGGGDDSGSGDADADSSGDGGGDDTGSGDADGGADGGAGDADALGDAGKKALDAMKADRNAAKAEAKAAKTYAEGLEAAFKTAGLEPGADIKALLDTTKTDTLSAAHQRVLAAEVKAAAAAKLHDPADALAHLDLTKFSIDDDGNVDADSITASITKLLEDKPYLAAQREQGWGDGDGGARPPGKPRPANLQAAVDNHYSA